MKYLKIFIGLIALLFLLFFARGFITPSISYGSEIVVDKPVEEAWAVMNDETKLSQWLSGIKEMEHISGVKGTVGAVTKYTFDENGQESTIVETIRKITADEQIVMDFVMQDVMTMDYKVDFSEQGNQTLVKSSTVTTGAGMFMKSMVAFMKGGMQKQEDENMSKLKKLINGNQTDYFPEPVEELMVN